MSTVTASKRAFGSDSQLGDRNTHRMSGWLIAIVSSVVLWSVSGAALWGILNIIN